MSLIVLDKACLDKISNSFKHPAIEKYSETDSAFFFNLVGIETHITLEILYSPPFNNFTYRLSHYIKTPFQMDAYRPGFTPDEDIGYLVSKAISALTHEYDIAIKKGARPHDSWLVPNNFY
jgi:hypothetical protein